MAMRLPCARCGHAYMRHYETGPDDDCLGQPYSVGCDCPSYERPSEPAYVVDDTPTGRQGAFLRALWLGHKLTADGTLDPTRCLADVDLDIEQQPMRCSLDAGHVGFHHAGRGPGEVCW